MSNSDFYRLQGKVIFSQVSVCLSTGTVDLCPGDFCPGGSLFRGLSVQRVAIKWRQHSLEATAPVGTHPAGMHSCGAYVY